MNSRKIFLWGIVLIAIAIFILAVYPLLDSLISNLDDFEFNNFDNSINIHGKYPENYVVDVIDGDTFVVMINGSEEKVRLICIDAPEIDNKEGKGEDSKDFLSDLILNKQVRLEKDVSERDIYGRLLRYVWVDEIFVNRELVKNGYASVFRYGNDTKRCDEIEG